MRTYRIALANVRCPASAEESVTRELTDTIVNGLKPLHAPTPRSSDLGGLVSL